ncbi:glycosyltransferase family 4 protein [Gillisia sp. CAL575]|uniref:glycosyltransferase family 4 protein n=1 Tax=Gillisia sp. CAL575 TaxID=985255 RepID=UPI0003A44AB0|nr:glycosyltransferase family 4 protein [Gillisia sp. CAL575]
MKFLYYSTSYYANHGGSIQSIEFFNQLGVHKDITEKAIFPIIQSKGELKIEPKFSIRSFLRKIPLLQVLFFFRRNSFHFKKLVEKIQEFKPDIILIQIDSNFLQIKRLKKRFPELIICNQINGSPFDEPFKNIAFKNIFLNMQLQAYLHSDLNIFISDFSRTRIMGDHVNNGRDVVIHNGTDPDKFFPMLDPDSLRIKWNYPIDKFVIGYIGTLDFHKQLGVLIDVFNELLKDNPNLYLVIVGDGPALAKLKEKVVNLSLSKNVCLRGWIKHEDINENLNCFDLAVHHYANTYMNPLKIFEYLSAGLPVIAPDIPSVRAIFRDREDLLITGPSHMELKNAMKEVLTDDNLKSRLSNNQHLIHEIEGNYTWKKYTNSIISKIHGKLNPSSHN